MASDHNDGTDGAAGGGRRSGARDAEVADGTDELTTDGSSHADTDDADETRSGSAEEVTAAEEQHTADADERLPHPAEAGDDRPVPAPSDAEQRTSLWARGGIVPSGRRATVEIARVPSWLATASAWAWRILLLIIAGAVALWVLVELYLVTLPVIIALILATLLVPPARWLESHGAPRAAAASVVVIGGLGAVAGLVALLVPPFLEQARELRPTLILAIDQLFEFLETNFGWDQEEVLDMIDQAIAAASERGGEIASQVVSGAAIAAQSIVALVLAIVLLFFFVKDGEQITSWMIDRTPSPYEATIRAVGRRSWAALAGFVRGTAAIALIDAVGIGVGLAIVGVPLVLPIAVLVFLGGFVPVIGAFVTGLIAVLVALVAGGIQQALIVLAIVVGVQQFESNVLQPVIMRRAVALHPVVILAALTAGAALIGVIGAFLAVPIAAVASAAANELRLRHEAMSAGVDLDREDDPLGPPDRPVPTDKL